MHEVCFLCGSPNCISGLIILNEHVAIVFFSPIGNVALNASPGDERISSCYGSSPCVIPNLDGIIQSLRLGVSEIRKLKLFKMRMAL